MKKIIDTILEGTYTPTRLKEVLVNAITDGCTDLEVCGHINVVRSLTQEEIDTYEIADKRVELGLLLKKQKQHILDALTLMDDTQVTEKRNLYVKLTKVQKDIDANS